MKIRASLSAKSSQLLLNISYSDTPFDRMASRGSMGTVSSA
ncbi:MAG: hypothetical protein QXW47_11970 [Candidatus Jordarchaeales archaeon]